jgi:hypothetical protein
MKAREVVKIIEAESPDEVQYFIIEKLEIDVPAVMKKPIRLSA